jgi:pimeloyl-ACP methyl ester carboxylesterase
LRALDGWLIDLSELHCGESVTATIDIAERRHLVHVTEARRADPSGESHTVLMLPGFTETVERGSGRNLHDAVSNHYPYSRVLSIATDGVGLPCRRLGWQEGLSLNFDTMADDRLQIAEQLSADGPVTMVNVSMGSVIGLKLALQNLREQRLQLEHIINHSHAQVPLGHIPRDMIARFLPHIAVDGLREAIRHPAPFVEHALGSLALLAQAPSYLGNIKNLLGGSNPADMYAVAEQVPTTYISGEHDPLAQTELLMRLQQALPGQVNIVQLPGRGHASSLDATQAARDIASIDSRASA